MAKVGPITAHLSIAVGEDGVPIEVATFDIPLRVSSDIQRGDRGVTVTTRVDRTATRERISAAFRQAADYIDTLPD